MTPIVFLIALNILALWLIYRALTQQFEAWLNRADGEHGRYQIALKGIATSCLDEDCKEIARKALEE